MRIGGVLLVLTACGRLDFDPRIEPPDYCARIPALGSAPIIDGTPEPLPLQRLVPVGWLSKEQPLAVPDVPVHFAIGWRPDGLYMFIDVADPDRYPSTTTQTYCGDGAELYVDADGEHPAAPEFEAMGVRQFIAPAPRDDTTSRADGDYWLKGVQLGAWSSGYGVFPRPGGYALEAMIDAAVLGVSQWSLAAGDHVGVDLGVNLSRPDGTPVPIPECPENLRLGQFFLRIDDSIPVLADGAPFWAPTAYCTAELE